MQKIICVRDGINDFGTSFGEVKKGEIYHVLDTTHHSQFQGWKASNPHTGLWYRLVERPGWHWHGLFQPLDQTPLVTSQSSSLCVDSSFTS